MNRVAEALYFANARGVMMVTEFIAGRFVAREASVPVAFHIVAHDHVAPVCGPRRRSKADRKRCPRWAKL